MKNYNIEESNEEKEKSYFIDNLNLYHDLDYDDYRRYYSSMETEIRTFSSPKRKVESELITNKDHSKIIKCSIPDLDWAFFLQYLRLCDPDFGYFGIDKKEYIPMTIIYKKESESEDKYRKTIIINREARKGKKMTDLDARDIRKMGLDDDLLELYSEIKEELAKKNMASEEIQEAESSDL